MTGDSADIVDEQQKKLRELFPEVFTEGKIDWNKLRATLGEQNIDLGERYGLSWKGKSSAFAKIQEKTTATLHPQPEESVDWDTTQNMFIEGDNLEALKVLHKAYYGKIKMIYIDPPYNTGNDFVYNDDFKQTRASYNEEAGITDEEGNVTRDDGLRVNTGGHKHSNWLDMMHPRLFLARNLLRQDGVIFISIDDNEVHNLRLIMNEIFGEENFIAQIIWQKVFSPKNSAKYFSEDHEYILVYARNAENWAPNLIVRSEDATARYTNPDDDPRGPWTSSDLTARNYYSRGQYEVTGPTGKKFNSGTGRYWRQSYEKFLELNQDGRIWWGQDGNNMPRFKRFLSEVKQGVVPQTLWTFKDVGHTQDAKRTLLSNVTFENNENMFNTVKPVSLIQRMIQISSKAHDNDIILDFFAGSGTTAQAVLQQNIEDSGNRRYITVQLPEILPQPETRLKTVADITKERVRNFAIKLATTNNYSSQQATPLDIGFRTYKIGETNFKQWNQTVTDSDSLRQQSLEHLNPIKSNTRDKDLLTEILIKLGISPLITIETHQGYYFIPSNELVISLRTEIDEQFFEQMVSVQPVRIIILDRAFQNNSNLKTNLILKAEKGGISVDVI
ncbi:MAG TPA: site-specific DNA-methyltransferase [Candidatus Limnocylindrales bacterium]|nr:site-specific DNA-methyltransferase [Candidatus Limnocylindrales bacterium]